MKYQLDAMAMEFYGQSFDECDQDQQIVVKKAVDSENTNEAQQAYDEQWGDPLDMDLHY